MRLITSLPAGLFLWPSAGMAQSTSRIQALIVSVCGTAPNSGYVAGTYQFVTMDTNGQLCPGTGGGGGGGAVTVADGADVTQGAIADAAASAGGTGTVSAKLREATALLNSIVTNTGAAIPAAVAPTVGASGSITNLVLDASPTTAAGGVKHFHAENATTTNGYCIIYNGTTAPSTGALTAANVLKFQLLPASGYCDWQANSVDPPIAASVGAVFLVSSGSTPYTYTTGIITASMEGLAQ